MGVDASIAMGVRPMQLESPFNALSGALGLQNAMRQNQLGGLQLEQQKADMADNAALRAALGSGLDLNTPEGQQALYKAAPLKAAGVLKGQQEILHVAAQTEQAKAAAAKSQQEALTGTFDLYHRQLGGVNDYQSAVDFVKRGAMDPVMGKLMGGMQGATAEIAKIPRDPEGLKKWVEQQSQAAMTVKDRITNATTIRGQDTTAATARADNIATNAAHIQAAGISAGASRANNRDNIAKDYAIAGIGPDGAPSANVESMAQMIAAGKAAPISGFALARPQGQAVMARVAAINPNYDATEYGAKAQAMKSFATGKDGQAVQSANTALNHLDTLKQLAVAQANGNMRLVNEIANKIATEMGGTAPANLQAAVTMVGPEISKAVVGAGGGVSDREKVDSALAALVKGGPAQAAGVVNTMQELFGGRLTEAQRTYERTTGRKDFTDTLLSPAAREVLSHRTGAPKMAIPNDIAAILAKHGPK